MKRNIKKTIKKAVVAVAAASMLTVLTAPLAVMPVSAATVTRGSYDFSNMVVRRVWFNTDDPVFLIDDYQRVWLDSMSMFLRQVMPQIQNRIQAVLWHR